MAQASSPLNTQDGMGCDREFMSYPAAKGNTGVPPVLASGHPDRGKSLVGGTPATRHSRDGQVPLHEKAAANVGMSNQPSISGSGFDPKINIPNVAWLGVVHDGLAARHQIIGPHRRAKFATDL